MVTGPLVGAHFRPPAKAILGVLPIGCVLTLTPEPTNAYDENAIMVHVRTADIPRSADADLDAAASGFGYDAASIREREAWQLGYIAKEVAATVRLRGPQNGSLGYTPEGKPQVNFIVEE